MLYSLHQVATSVQALFGNLGSHKLAPAVEARAEFLTAAVGEDGPAQLAQVRHVTVVRASATRVPSTSPTQCSTSFQGWRLHAVRY